MNAEEFDKKFDDNLKSVWNWANTHRLVVMVGASFLIGMFVGAVGCSKGKAATINISGTATPVAQCVTLSSTAQASVATLMVTCDGVTPPTPPPPGPGCVGFMPQAIDIAWPVGNSVHQLLPFFGPSTALVYHFKTGPGSATPDSKLFTIVNTSGPNYTALRMSLANAPGCNTPTKYPPSAPIMWASVSQNPSLNLSVGTPVPNTVLLQPNTDYWITVVNRNGYPGVNTCPRTDCSANRKVDFNN